MAWSGAIRMHLQQISHWLINSICTTISLCHGVKTLCRRRRAEWMKIISLDCYMVVTSCRRMLQSILKETYVSDGIGCSSEVGSTRSGRWASSCCLRLMTSASSTYYSLQSFTVTRMRCLTAIYHSNSIRRPTPFTCSNPNSNLSYFDFRIIACLGPATNYICTDFSVDSSSHFPFRAQTDRQPNSKYELLTN